MRRSLVNFLLFQVGWFACVLGAADGQPWLGPLVGAPLVAFHLWTSEDRWAEARLLALVGVIGSAVDTGLDAAGFIAHSTYAPLPEPFVPAWIATLWVLFGTLLRRSLAWLARYRTLAFVLGAVGGPLSMLSGVRLGALEWGPDVTASMITVGVEWAILTPALLALAHRSERRRPQTASS